MSKFLEELKNAAESVKDIEECLASWTGRNSDIYREFDNLTTLIDSLGENAKRMLGIGIVQDELIKLGFEQQSDFIEWHNWESQKSKKYENIIQIYFYKTYIYLQGETFNYTSPTWQRDVLDKVKELIND